MILHDFLNLARPGVNYLPVASTAAVEVLAIFISNLSTRLATTILTTFDESGVPIHSDNAIVQSGAIDVSHARFSVFPIVVFSKAKTAWSLKLMLMNRYCDY